MEDKLRRYVDGLFARTVPTKKAVELKEEMLQNMQDKYNDLISEGKEPEAAYNIVVAGVGDVGSLLSELEEDNMKIENSEQYEVQRRQSAMLTSIAVMMYILGAAQWIILGSFGFYNAARIGSIGFFILVIGATGILVYNGMTKPRRYKGSDTMVEEFREWQSDNYDRKALRRSISAALWSVITALYFVVSFWTGAWHVTWIAFILGAVVEALINLFVALKK